MRLKPFSLVFLFFRVKLIFFQAEDGIRDRSPSRGLGDVYKRQGWTEVWQYSKLVKCPLENQYFASYIAIAAVYFERICI